MDYMDAASQSLIQEALAFLQQHDTVARDAIDAEYQRVMDIVRMAKNFPSLLPGASPDPEATTSNRLVKMLCSIDAGMSSLNMPVRAVMGGAFLTGKVQLFNAIHQKLEVHADKAPPELLQAAQRQMAQSIYTMLLAGLLWDLVRNKDNRSEIRERAADELVHLWERPEQLTVSDFFPVLEAVWQARNRVKVTYGSLMGVTEFFQLVREECPNQFINFFTRDTISPDELAAFQEFLFGIPQEQLNRLREAMKKSGMSAIDPKFAESTLKLSELSSSSQGTPQALYASHRRRQRAAELRRLTGIPGPTNTAEEYLILYFLQQPAGMRAQTC